MKRPSQPRVSTARKDSDLIRRRAFLQKTGIAVALAGCAGPGFGAARSSRITEENEKPGTREWLLKNLEPAPGGQGDDQFARRRAIEGFCSHPSVRAGDTLRLFVSTDPPSEFRADFYRMGYYGGAGAHHVLSVGPQPGTPQPTPEDGPKNVRECRWSESLAFAIPRDWLSGVYLGKLTALRSGHEAYVVFIVRDDRRADFLFQCSDLTWQAYNRWPGWRSLYDWEGNKWHTKLGADVCFDRPYSIYYNGLPARFNALTNGSGEFLLWEHPLAYWMEKEGYDVTYISNLDTHTDANGLLRAKGFLSVGHDEYWTRQMFENVSRARDEGLNLAFLSGNSVWYEIDLRPNSTGASDRVFGRARDFEDEHELMGASSYGVGAADWICAAPEHWLFEGTGMRAGDAIRDLVGWEFHGPPLRNDPNLVVLASGEFKGRAEGKSYAATIYPGPKGNFVFNAATCWWSMVLSSPPGKVNPPNKDFSRDDARVQRMTQNLLDRMLRT